MRNFLSILLSIFVLGEICPIESRFHFPMPPPGPSPFATPICPQVTPMSNFDLNKVFKTKTKNEIQIYSLNEIEKLLIFEYKVLWQMVLEGNCFSVSIF
jgi:hypothetical protein